MDGDAEKNTLENQSSWNGFEVLEEILGITPTSKNVNRVR